MLQAEKDQAIDLLHQEQSSGSAMRCRIESDGRYRDQLLTYIDSQQATIIRLAAILEVATSDSTAGKEMCGTTLANLQVSNEKLKREGLGMMEVIDQKSRSEHRLLIERDQYRL